VNDILKAVVLGAVQGLTEFLPISSSAHLILVPWAFGWRPFGLAFDIALHMGTLTAVIVYFFRDLWAMFTGVLRSWRRLLRLQAPADQEGRLGLYIVAGSIPAAVVGLLISDTIDNRFHAGDVSNRAIALIAVLLIGFGLLLGLADRYGRRPQQREIEQLGLADALFVGCAQVLALMPGVSRSGSTITASLFRGMSRRTAARFSFLLGVPVILGAGLKDAADLAREGIPHGERGVFLAGVLSAMLVGYAAVAGLMRYLQRRTTDVFVIYRVALGLSVLALVAAGFRG
jgi:undecaprenyl-diphosphatase